MKNMYSLPVHAGCFKFVITLFLLDKSSQSQQVIFIFIYTIHSQENSNLLIPIKPRVFSCPNNIPLPHPWIENT